MTVCLGPHMSGTTKSLFFTLMDENVGRGKTLAS